MNRPRTALALVVASTVLGLMGTDLALPAVPSLPETPGGGPTEAQLVLAAYVGGTGFGLLLFGALGDRFATRRLLIASLLLTAGASFACAMSPAIWSLITLRIVQGAVASGPAVFAPAIVRAMFDGEQAIHAIGALGSIESLAPALAPILGAWLLTLGGWELSFGLIGAIALILAGANLALPLIPQISRRTRGSYARLLSDPVYLRSALSQAFVLGGLLVFVFGAPAVLVRSFGGTLSDFIMMQVIGIPSFILAANVAGSLVTKFGAERMIVVFGALLASALFLRRGFGSSGWGGAYECFRADLGRGILLGLEFLVAGDIIGTVAVAPTFESLGVLAAIVVIRTFLSFSLEVEIDGRWPWQRHSRANGSDAGA